MSTVSHLLIATDALVEGHRTGTYVAACGEASPRRRRTPKTSAVTPGTAPRASAPLSVGAPMS